MKHLFILYLTSLVILITGCKRDNNHSNNDSPVKDYQKISGQTMGTTYNISVDSSQVFLSKKQIDSILIDINLSLSTYIDSSTISKCNSPEKYGETITLLENGKYKTFDRITLSRDDHFIKNYEKAKQIFLESNGHFDPTVMPLVNYWGFGYEPKKAISKIDTQKVQEMLTYTGMEKLEFRTGDETMVLIKPEKAQLDFSAIAKGYAVDYLSDFLSAQGLQNYMVEIGGEVMTRGRNRQNQNWKIGLSTPKEYSAIDDFSSILDITEKAIASSGNYRIYYKVGQKKYGHEINPRTGYPEMNELLGVSVVAPNCIEADAIATACMIMGYEESRAYIEDYMQLEACFFTSNKDGEIIQSFSSGFEQFILKE